MNKKTASKMVKFWKDQGSVLLMTEQTQGHPYKIIIKE